MNRYPTMASALTAVRRVMENSSKVVHSKHWQGVDISAKPEAAMHESCFVSFEVALGGDLDYYRHVLRPNLPWADDHFAERVCGSPINPGKEWANWPYAHSANGFRDDNGQFNHTYMERYWAGQAGLVKSPTFDADQFLDRITRMDEYGPRSTNRGIRYRYGDLDDLVGLLLGDPLTRQAYLPIFFPEDTGLANPDRKPCTLGYLFMMRDDQLHITYYIRSCDYMRHFRDDIYLTIRLLYWVIEKLQARDERWNNVTPGLFRMDIGSLHLFRNDYAKLFG